MELHWIEIVSLIVAGLMVGFINTLAGGGSMFKHSLPVPASGNRKFLIHGRASYWASRL